MDLEAFKYPSRWIIERVVNLKLYTGGLYFTCWYYFRYTFIISPGILDIFVDFMCFVFVMKNMFHNHIFKY